MQITVTSFIQYLVSYVCQSITGTSTSIIYWFNILISLLWKITVRLLLLKLHFLLYNLWKVLMKYLKNILDVIVRWYSGFMYIECLIEFCQCNPCLDPLFQKIKEVLIQRELLIQMLCFQFLGGIGSVSMRSVTFCYYCLLSYCNSRPNLELHWK